MKFFSAYNYVASYTFHDISYHVYHINHIYYI